MADTKMIFSINGQQVNNPRNIAGISLEAQWGDTKEEGTLDVESLQWVRDEVQIIKDRIEGNLGIFQALPLTIDIVEQGNYFRGFEGYLDLAQSLQKIGCDEYVTSVVPKGSLTWIEEKADAFSFAYLESIGTITSADYVDVPCINEYKIDILHIAMLALSGYMITQELIRLGREISDGIAEIVNGTIPNTPAPLPSFDIGDVIWAVLKLAARIAVAIAMTIALVQVIKQIIDELYPPLKYHKAMTYKRLWEKGCEHLNLQFKSTIFDDPKYSGLVYLPQKDKPGGELPENGVPANGGPIYTFGDFIRFMKARFNADFKIYNNELRFERWDYWTDTSTYILPNTSSNQEIAEHEYGYNTDEIVSNLFISYQYDTNDLWTLDLYKGSNCQVITKNAIGDSEYNTIKGLEEVRFPVARGVRKNELSRIERAVKTLARALDIFAGGGLSSLVQNRVGSLKMTSELVAVPKEIHMTGRYLTPNQIIYVGAKEVYESFYFINSFDPTQTGNIPPNQWLNYKDVEIPFCFSDWLKLEENNYFRTFEGKTGRLRQLSWNIEEDKAIVSYQVQEVYTGNLETQIVIEG